MSLRIYPSTIGSVFYGAVFARRAVCSAGRPRNTCTSGMARCSVCQMKISRPRYLTVSTTLFFSLLLFPYSSDLSSPAILPSHSFSPPASPTSVFVLSTLNSSLSPFSSPPSLWSSSLVSLLLLQEHVLVICSVKQAYYIVYIH